MAWHFGQRNTRDTDAFCRKLAKATTGHFQLSSDAWRSYHQCVTWNLLGRVDYGQLLKIYANPSKAEQRRYSPPAIIGSRRQAVLGQPAYNLICTSHAERMNGSIRHFTKRMARLTCAFSKRWDAHRAAMAVFFAHYNFCRKHSSLKGQTPAMATGLANEVWTVKKLLAQVMHT